MKLIFTLFVLPCIVICQSGPVVKGIVYDAGTNMPLPFSSLGLKKQMNGTVSNESGEFEFILPDGSEQDTLVFSAFGYHRVAVAVNKISGPLNIRLKEAPVQLQEVSVVPREPEYYIVNAIRRLKYNYPVQPFESVAYYREKVLENKSFVKMDEGVFKTYCPRYQDTIKNQDQLLLFRTADNIKELAFMAKERKEAEEKRKKEEKKTGQKSEKKEDKEHVEIDLTSSFGGPAAILKSSRISHKSENYLDTTKLKDFNFSFAKSKSYEYGTLMVIDFSSKGKVDHVRESGRLYIDPYTFAIAKIESAGAFVIPVLLRPIIFMYGYGIDNPSFVNNVEFQQVGDRWYPRNVLMNIDISLTRRHWFSKNESSDFEIEQAYVVNKIDTEKADPIADAKRFDPTKPMKEQVQNDAGLNWSQVNVIR